MTERPHNIRASRILERSYGSAAYLNSRRSIPEARPSRDWSDDHQIVNNAYRGNHRAAGQHHAEQTAAELRSSRVGRHHADHRDGYWTR